MALIKTKNRASVQASAAPATPRSMIASAARMRNIDGFTWSFGFNEDRAWQADTWRLYDCVGELHDAADWIGSACSRVRIYVAEVDELGRVQGEVDDDPEIQALADNLFGGPAAKAEILRVMGISLTVAGECYLLGRSARPNGGRDRWAVASPLEVNSQGTKLYLQQSGSDPVAYTRGRDVVTRIWTPHPSNMWRADAPARSALHVLTQLEKLTRFTDSQLDSRIANGMVWIIPSGLEFPTEEGQTVSEAIMDLILEAMEASLTGNGQASGIAPIIIEVPQDLPAPIAELLRNPVSFASILSEQAAQLRDEAIRRLSISMNIPPEVLLGMGQTANHFNIWHVEESAVKVHIEPIMNRICDALTTSWLTPALKALGKDPARYTYWFDTASLTVRPNRLSDSLTLYDKKIISAEAVRRYGDYKEVDAPSEEEISRRNTFEVMLRDPTLFADPNVRAEAGIDVDLQQLSDSATPPPPPPRPELTNGNRGPVPPAELPEGAGSAPGDELFASLVAASSPILEAAHHTVRRALELAGNRMLTAEVRKTAWRDTPKHMLHTKVKIDPGQLTKLLASAWDNVDTDAQELGVDPQAYARVVDNYTKTLLVRSVAHEKTMLASVLRDEGLIR